MKNIWARALGLGLLIVCFAACSTGGDDDDNPPPTVYKYYAYVANGAGGDVTGFSIDPTTGALTVLAGSPFPTGAVSTPLCVVVDPTGKYAYAASGAYGAPGYISTYTVDKASGRLTGIAGSPLRLDNGLGGIAINSTGRFAYIAEWPSQVRGYDINIGQGALTAEIQGSPYGFGGDPWNRFIKAAASGHNLLYVANTAIGLHGYKINSTTGELTLIQGSPFPGTEGVIHFDLDLEARFLYAVSEGGSHVQAFTIDPVSGQLSVILGSPFAAGTETSSVAVDPLGRYAYVTNFSSDEVIAYTINSVTGTLNLVGSSYRLGSHPSHVMVEPTGKFVYVANTGPNDISVYAINQSTGALTQIVGSPFSLGALQYPQSIAIVKIAQ